MLIEQETGYPAEGEVKITIHLNKSESFPLRFRIPSWSMQTEMIVNGDSVYPEPGEYCIIERLWKDGDVVELSLDFSPHFWAGAENRTDHISVYTGPILLAVDERFNTIFLKNEVFDLEQMKLDVPTLEMTKTTLELIPEYPEPIVLYTIKTSGGDEIVLCDFATAGMSGTRYTTWIPATGIQSINYDDGAAKWIGWRK